MTEERMPRRVRTYRNHHLDSTRWDSFRPRQGDVVISTSLKAGTTWMGRIVSLLVFGTRPLPDRMGRLAPWVDFRVDPLDEAIERLERQDHRRFVKSHLPLDALPYYPEVRYIWVARDTRDVFMSLWNHYSSHTDAAYEKFAAGNPEGGPLPRCPADPREFWRGWMTRSSFPWERDGWPFWSHHYHASSFWEFRHLPNLLVVHYNDLLADLAGEMRRIASFMSIDVPKSELPALVQAATFESMKQEAIAGEAKAPKPFMATMWKEGPASFFFKGTNGRWRDVLTEGDLALYEGAASVLDPGLRSWLEAGRLVAGDPQPHRRS
jgi:aryl sulfotransferase